ncbi:MAG TPA: flagellar export protein FliJ [Lacipirellulaceae bacterium]|nr:flagellar export protein FliJ [Lacipirellulaceae bacterium]
MARFRFRLETLRRLREVTRDELRVRLAEAFQAEQILAEQRRMLAVEAAALGDMRREMMAGGAVQVTRLLESQRYQLMLEAQQRTLAEQAARLAEEVDVRRQAVVEADRQVRVLDKLRERRAAQHRAAQTAAEDRRLDEVAITRWRPEQ